MKSEIFAVSYTLMVYKALSQQQDPDLGRGSDEF